MPAEYTHFMQENIALYRKYRPETFEDVIGQDHIVNVLKAALKEGKVSHAYLLTGSRGTGKTTIARIIARELGTSPNDIYEMDAASNRGIDDIRELREGVRTLPFDSKYKVYIIDEVHMLTKEAFNALLKTLEEPPAHVIFILATTELEKVPETIVSRCQNFQFKKPTEAILKTIVEHVAKKEKVKIAGDAAELIALLGDGSFRDTLGMLQKVVSFGGKDITRDEVEKITGAPKASLVNGFIEAIKEKNIKKGLQVVTEAKESNLDMRVYLKLILHKFRAVLLLRYAPDMKKHFENEFSHSDMEFILSLTKEKDSSINSKTLTRLLQAYQEVLHTFIPVLPIEIALIDLIGEVDNK